MSNQQWYEEYDVVVVGSGAGAMTAAIVAADQGASALVLEKCDRFGGTTATSGAVLWIPKSHLAQASGTEDSTDEAVTYIKSLAGEDCSEPLIHTYVNRGKDMLRYMTDHTEVAYNAIPYPDYQPEQPGGKSGWRSHDCETMDGRLLGDDLDKLERPHQSNMLFGRFVWKSIDAAKLVTRTKGWMGAMARTFGRYYCDIGQRLKSDQSRFLTGGNALIGRLKLSMDQRNIPLWLNSPLKELICDEQGRVTGVLIKRNGQLLAIRARKGVVLAAGGFEHNSELRAKYLPASANTEWSAAVKGNTGDALVAAMNIGAATAMMDSAWRAPVLHVPGEELARPLFIERSLPGSIIVNQAGKRFMNEAADYHTVGESIINGNQTDAGTSPCYILFDSLFKWRYPMGPVLPIIPIWMHGKGVRELLIRARTWDEMAQKLRIDPDDLKTTVKRFNDHAIKGEDPDFHRGESLYDRLYGDQKITTNPSLMPLAKGPFYALPLYPGDIGTNGGLRISVDGEVIHTDGKPIAGLYATGNITASPVGRGYPGGGATIGPAMTFGYLAALHATRVSEQANNATAKSVVEHAV